MKKPYTILVCAITIDGKLASSTYYSKLSCPYDLKRLHMLRANVDAVMVGANTVIIDNPMLTVRYVSGKNPIRVVIDGLLKIPLNAKILDTSIARTIIVTSSKAPKEKIKKVKEKGVEVLIFNQYPIDLKEVFEKLYELGIKKLLVEGGGTLNWYLLKYGLIDEMYITITPYIFGSGISIFQTSNGFKDIYESPKFKLKGVLICECGNEIVLNYVKTC